MPIGSVTTDDNDADDTVSTAGDPRSDSDEIGWGAAESTSVNGIDEDEMDSIDGLAYYLFI